MATVLDELERLSEEEKGGEVFGAFAKLDRRARPYLHSLIAAARLLEEEMMMECNIMALRTPPQPWFRRRHLALAPLLKEAGR